VPHIELIETLEERLQVKLNASIEHEEFAVRRQQSTLFGVLTINYNNRTQLMARSFLARTQMSRPPSASGTPTICRCQCSSCGHVGVRVRQHGPARDMILMRRKHTLDLSLVDEIDMGIDRFVDHYAHLERETQLLRTPCCPTTRRRRSYSMRSLRIEFYRFV